MNISKGDDYLSNEVIEIELTPLRERFYNERTNFGVVECETVAWEKVELDYNGRFTITGIIPRLTMKGNYSAELVKKMHPKYGLNYEVKSINQLIPSSVSEQKAYLKTILTDLQVNAIYDAYPEEDVIKLFQDNTFDYKKVKGIGEVTYQNIRARVLENLNIQKALAQLGRYNITYNTILKLIKHYGSAEMVIQKVEANPYCLTEVSGIGFTKADAIAQAMNYDLQSPFRIRAALEYVIEQEQFEGHTYINKKKLIEMTEDLIKVPFGLVEKQIDKNENIIEVDERVTLKSIYEAEKYIAEKVKELLDNPIPLEFDSEKFIQEQERELGIKLTQQQAGLFKNIRDHRFNTLVGYAGCVDKETEFFNGCRWKKISDYQEGDMVLQYNEDGIAELVNPIMYHKLPETKMMLIKNKSGSVNQCLSNDHTVVYRTSKGNLAKLPLTEVKKMHDKSPNGFYGKFYTTFNYSGKGIDLTDEQIRVMVMVIADGYFPNNTSLCRIRVKKERKKIRVRKLLTEAKIPYQEQNNAYGYKAFVFSAPIRLKHFDSTWYQCSQHQLQVICDEVLYWDGSIDAKGRQRFNSNVKETAEFIQFAFSATGHRATISERDRTSEQYKDSKYIRKTKEYGVHISKNKWASIMARTSDKKLKLIEVEPKDGFKYCFTVPSGMWVMRREGRICVTGNCGKTQMQKLLINLLKQLGISYRLLSPTGKAAKVLSSYVGEEATTIHRAMGFDLQGEIREQFVIVDEVSMLGVKLASRLLRNCKHPELRVLFVGDSFQLPSVEAGNLLHDMITSGVVPLTELNQVFRQEEGGILDIATKIRKGVQFIDDDFIGGKMFGKDFQFYSAPQEKMIGGYKYGFNKLNETYHSDDIMLLSSTKKGSLGTIAINGVVQEIINPASEEKPEYEYGNGIFYRVGDLIINTKNLYDIDTVNGEKTNIVNGDIGKIIEVNKEIKKIIIDYGFAIVPVSFSDLDTILHANCLTIHKSQGSASKAVLAIFDKSHTYQLNANLIYTAITRAREFVFMLCQAYVINRAIKKVANMQRNTFLKELLLSFDSKGEE